MLDRTPIRQAIAALNRKGAGWTAQKIADKVSEKVEITGIQMSKIISAGAVPTPLQAVAISEVLSLDEREYPLWKLWPELNLSERDERMLRSQAHRRLTALDIQKNSHNGGPDNHAGAMRTRSIRHS